MKSLISIPIVLIAAFWSIMSSIILVGKAQPVPESVQRLHLADCALPCWANITPGVTPASEVEMRINALFPDFTSSIGPDGKLYWMQTDEMHGIRTIILITLHRGIVSDIGIGIDHKRAEMPSLGEILTVFGSPTCVVIDDRSVYSKLFYESAANRPMLQFSVRPPSMSSSVNNLVFGAARNATCQNAFAMSWHEFRVSAHSALLFS